MADAFGLFQLLSSGTSIFVYSDALRDDSVGYKQSVTVNLPNDIRTVVGYFTNTGSSIMQSGSCVFKPNGRTYMVTLVGGGANVSTVTLTVQLSSNYSQATVSCQAGPTAVVILAW